MHYQWEHSYIWAQCERLWRHRLFLASDPHRRRLRHRLNLPGALTLSLAAAALALSAAALAAAPTSRAAALTATLASADVVHRHV